MLAFFAVAVMLLTIMGIYGGVNFLVERRRREIGVRIALGAQRRSIYRLAIQQGMKPVVLAAWPD